MEHKLGKDTERKVWMVKGNPANAEVIKKDLSTGEVIDRHPFKLKNKDAE